ncbi:MAG: TIM barrel protein, partial [Bryobacteraceae bacterium]
MEPKWIGYYFDPCHATAEGGSAGWQLAFRVAAPRLKMVAAKDFYWEKSGGRWRMKMCPLGEGMVDWARFFQLLREARFAGPISLHLEYPAKDEREAMSRDLAFLRKMV